MFWFPPPPLVHASPAQPCKTRLLHSTSGEGRGTGKRGERERARKGNEAINSFAAWLADGREQKKKTEGRGWVSRTTWFSLWNLQDGGSRHGLIPLAARARPAEPAPVFLCPPPPPRVACPALRPPRAGQCLSLPAAFPLEATGRRGGRSVMASDPAPRVPFN